MTPLNKKLLAWRLKFARESRGYSRRDLGLRMGVATTTIGAYERGEMVPQSARLYQFAVALNCSTDWLLGLPQAGEPVPRAKSNGEGA